MIDFRIRSPLSPADVDELLEALGAQRPGALAFIAEKFGHFVTGLLEHPEESVREGAVKGMVEAPAKIVLMAHADPSPTVKKAAYETIGAQHFTGE